MNGKIINFFQVEIVNLLFFTRFHLARAQGENMATFSLNLLLFFRKLNTAKFQYPRSFKQYSSPGVCDISWYLYSFIK